MSGVVPRQSVAASRSESMATQAFTKSKELYSAA